jgi:hypothetical protein
LNSEKVEELVNASVGLPSTLSKSFEELGANISSDHLLGQIAFLIQE